MQGILLIPLGVVAGVVLHTQSLPIATVVVIVVANAYGAAIWLLGRRIAWRFVWWRLPELLSASLPRQAG